jgi:ActR/RegA family two-component response regulator
VDDDDVAISYKVLKRGTVVRTSDGQELGTVDEVLDNAKEQIFDGIVVDTTQGLRFVDAPEVARITERSVMLTIDAYEAAQLSAPSKGAPEYRANPKSRFRPWRRK